MSDKLLTEMSREEFDAVIEAFIERESQDTGDVSAPIFYQTLNQIFQAGEPLPETIELQGEVIGSQLHLFSPSAFPLGITAQANEIVVNNIRFVIHLVPREKVPA